MMPLLSLAAQASDDDLQTRWAALLESAAQGSEGFLPSFGQTLSQISGQEARFLDRLYVMVTQPSPYNSQHATGREPMDSFALIRVFDPSIDSWMNPAERRFFHSRFTQEQLVNFAKVDMAELIIQDLERLGILVRDQITEPDSYVTIPHSIAGQALDSAIAGIAGKKIALHRSRDIIRSEYSLSPYGLNFVRAVTPKGTSDDGLLQDTGESKDSLRSEQPSIGH